jgi:MoxR-like ATPase
MRFQGTQSYVATDDLKVAVNAAVTLRRPLLVKGEPGTGKTVLAHEIAAALGAPLIEWHVKSTTKAHQGLYEYDAVARLRDGQLGDPRVHDISNYIRRGKLWEAFTAPELPSSDRRDRQGRHRIPERPPPGARPDGVPRLRDARDDRARERPIVVITSNNEKELPDAFLRRCFFHYIKFPDRETMQKIVDVHFPGIQKILVSRALDIFYQVRDVPGLKKKPSTERAYRLAEALLHEDMPLDVLQSKDASQGDPAAPRRPPQERAGRDAVRAAGLHGAAADLIVIPSRARSGIHERRCRTCDNRVHEFRLSPE